jgi:serine/threonine protein kinase
MSPEQSCGSQADQRTDIWAFGCVLYEMLTARRAFAGKTSSETIAAILHREPDLTALPDTTPSSLRRLLVRCLDKDPARRLQNISDSQVDLSEARAECSRMSLLARARRMMSTRRRSLLAAGLALPIGAAAAWLWW